METANLLKGHLYPSGHFTRCPRFHACQVTQKCQNFDRHRLDCSICESRVRMTGRTSLGGIPLPEHGGVLPEGEFVPDLQDAMKIIQTHVLRPLAHPDNPTSKFKSLADASREMDRIRKAQEIMAMFQTSGLLTMDEQVVGYIRDTGSTAGLGRIA